ncbi:MAG: COX15/CtaA family protein [Pseudomonadales bacterium]
MTARTVGVTPSCRHPVAHPFLARLAAVLVLLIIATNVLSAYLRLDEAGLSCTPWPDCYAQLAASNREMESALPAALAPHEQLKQAHRLLAGALVLVVLVVLHQRARLGLLGSEATLPFALAAVMLGLAVVGPASYLKTMPAIATTNLLGGLLLLALAWRLLLVSRRPRQVAVADGVRLFVLVSLVVVAAQSALGAWTSANFAGIACNGVFACEELAAPVSGLAAFNYFRELELDATGRVLMGPEAWLIQYVHRLGACLTAAVLALLAAGLWRQGLRSHAVMVGALLALQIGVGLAAVAAGMPLFLVLLHNLLAAGLVVVLVDINYRAIGHD